VIARDEGRHQPDDDLLWNESWYLDFATEDGALGGYLRLGLYPNQGPDRGVAWYWACLVGEGRPLLLVRDHEVPLPPATAGLEVRSSGLWAALHCETPFDHWSAGLEAFAVALDDPAEAYRGERGDQVALGFDLEWESAGPAYEYPGVTRYEVSCRVTGEVLVGSERIAVDCPGQRDHSWGHRDWWTFPWCWVAGRLDDGTAFHASRPEIPGVRYEPGYVLDARSGAGPEPISAFTVGEPVLGPEGLPESVDMQLGPLQLAVAPLHHGPVRLDAPDGRVGRLSRSLCRFAEAGGRTGTGWLELNQPPT
jgi:hypothetical protein